VVLGACLVGVAVGHLLRGADEAAELADTETMTITGSSLVAAAGLSSRLADVLDLDTSDLLVHGLLAFGTATALTYFAESLGGLLPGLDRSSG
jgi:hypothetical protein